MHINGTELIQDDLTKNSMGGTEQMIHRLWRSIPIDLIQHFQIVPGRPTSLAPDKVRVLWIHDTADDPMYEYLKNDGWRQFHKIVFVSDYQQHRFIKKFNIPWSRCVTLYNAIESIEWETKPQERINLVYTSTPQRGLNILLPVFDELSKKYDNIYLDVFSSYKLYGWEKNDEPYQNMFEFCEQHPKITYHKTEPNEVVREHLKTAHIFAYPSTWEETSCLCLIEAMSAGLVCVHPNFGALFETAAHQTRMYQFNENPSHHAGIFLKLLEQTILDIQNSANWMPHIKNQSIVTNAIYNWETRKEQWKALLTVLKADYDAQKEANKNVAFVYER